jgi:hypothetical protein
LLPFSPLAHGQEPHLASDQSLCLGACALPAGAAWGEQCERVDPSRGTHTCENNRFQACSSICYRRPLAAERASSFLRSSRFLLFKYSSTQQRLFLVVPPTINGALLTSRSRANGRLRVDYTVRFAWRFHVRQTVCRRGMRHR